METVIRVAVLYFALMLAFRVMGKRELGRMSPFELVTLMLIPEIVSPALARGDASLTHAIVGTSTVFGLVLLTSFLTHSAPSIAKYVEGHPTLLVRDGKFLPENMNRERIDPDEVYAELHRVGLEDVSQVRWAILEREGEITVVPKSRRDTVPPPKPAEMPQ